MEVPAKSISETVVSGDAISAIWGRAQYNGAPKAMREPYTKRGERSASPMEGHTMRPSELEMLSDATNRAQNWAVTIDGCTASGQKHASHTHSRLSCAHTPCVYTSAMSVLAVASSAMPAVVLVASASHNKYHCGVPSASLMV